MDWKLPKPGTLGRPLTENATKFSDYSSGAGIGGGSGLNWWDALREDLEMQYYSSPMASSFYSPDISSGRGGPAQTGVLPGGIADPSTSARIDPSRQRFFEQGYQDIYRDFLANQGASMRQGQAPMSFDAFLDTDPWTKRYSSLPQIQRGTSGMYTNPRTRFLYF